MIQKERGGVGSAHKKRRAGKLAVYFANLKKKRIDFYQIFSILYDSSFLKKRKKEKRMKFNPETFLTENNLRLFVEDFVFPEEEIEYNKRFLNTNFRPDINIPSKKTIIEFNGHYHYTSPKNIIRDIKLKEIASRENFQVIEIPYFIQLSDSVIKKIFPQAKNYTPSKYPHGFIDKKCKLPSEFCELGVQRFLNEIENDFSLLYNEIIWSLQTKIKKTEDTLLVVPPSMIRLLNMT